MPTHVMQVKGEGRVLVNTQNQNDANPISLSYLRYFTFTQEREREREDLNFYMEMCNLAEFGFRRANSYGYNSFCGEGGEYYVSSFSSIFIPIPPFL